MAVQLVALLVVIFSLGSHSVSIEEELLNYQNKINILQHLLDQDCRTFFRLSNLPKDNLSLLKIRFEKMVVALSECHKEKGKECAEYLDAPTILFTLFKAALS